MIRRRLDVDRRLALLDWARRARALIFEDDYDSEYRYLGVPIPALQGMDADGSVIYSGSFNKVLFPSLRLGYLVVSTVLVEKFAAARLIMDRHSSIIDQAILCEFITEGHFGRHIRRMRELYAARLAVLRESVEQKLAAALRIPDVEAGVHTVGWLGEGLSAGAVARAAAVQKVEVIPLEAFKLRAYVDEGCCWVSGRSTIMRYAVTWTSLRQSSSDRGMTQGVSTSILVTDN